MNKFYKTPIITSIVMLFLALFDLPTGYFTLLRIIVCGTAVYFAFIAKTIKKLSWIWTMGFIAILFNPFIPIHLGREMWIFIDVVVGFIFLIGIYALSSGGVVNILFKIWVFIKKIYKKELTIFAIILLTGFIVIGISNLFPSKPERMKVPGFTTERWAAVNKMWGYQEQHQEHKSLSALELAEKLSKENSEYQKDYSILKTWSEENERNKEFDTANSRLVEEKEKFSDKTKYFLRNLFRKEKVGRFGLFIIIFGYPIVFFIRFIIWTVKAPRINQHK